MARHGELMREQERRERMRSAVSTAFLASMWRTDGKLWEPWDVFPDLRDAPQDDDEDDDTPTMIGGDPAIVMAKLQAIAARQKIAEA